MCFTRKKHVEAPSWLPGIVYSPQTECRRGRVLRQEKG